MSARIRPDLNELEGVLHRIAEGWQRAQGAADDDYLDGVALHVHGFSNSLERLFERIATVVDGSKPAGENWHQALLAHMTAEVCGVRPAVLSEATREQLDTYRGFRIRHERGLSLQRLADLSGVAKSVLSYVESGKRQGSGLTLATALRIARALGVSLDVLAGTWERETTRGPVGPPAVSPPAQRQRTRKATSVA